jgi:hypothetical protein
LLSELIEDAWSILETKENELLAELSKPRPPKYSSLTVFKQVIFSICVFCGCLFYAMRDSCVYYCIIIYLLFLFLLLCFFYSRVFAVCSKQKTKKEFENFKCISASEDQDNELLFVCFEDRMLCVDASTASTLAAVEQLSFRAACVHSKRLTTSLNLVVLLAENGNTVIYNIV